jgi:hypothetical protein
MTGVSRRCEGLFGFPGNIAAAKNPDQCAVKSAMHLKMKKPGRKNVRAFPNLPV